MLDRTALVQQRLDHQGISRPLFSDALAAVDWLVAVQAQDYGAAKWALALRIPEATEQEIDRAFDAGTILRTHVMRPTWHFVTPADIRWLLALTAHRVMALNSSLCRKLLLDHATFLRSNDIITRALEGGNYLTRPELVAHLKQAGIRVEEDLQSTLFMMQAELDGIICSGPRRGKQFTYALLDERAPQTKRLDRDEALAHFTRRYFTSHGPATVQDFAWWSGLTITDVKAGLAMAASDLVSDSIDGQTYWFAPSQPATLRQAQIAYLLPNYDEYVVGYTDRSAIFDLAHTDRLDTRGNVLFTNTIVLNGQIIGTWKRTLKKETVIVELNLFLSLNDEQMQAILQASQRYGEFLEKKVQTLFAITSTATSAIY
ncbi:hypothetical protein KTT_50640 [Tengunoibacter tsumagoiensis]|uniref:Winged helix DNA-binding domain-containing protein n=2 Tax=Tengunoibacter tsumagoiensis TaxID=2014871 RepID=A0A402A878_9CHLR|nr:hypothetical protein KTT_50640 [Tengunoibacter tsumagoiensis]